MGWRSDKGRRCRSPRGRRRPFPLGLADSPGRKAVDELDTQANHSSRAGLRGKRAAAFGEDARMRRTGPRDDPGASAPGRASSGGLGTARTGLGLRAVRQLVSRDPEGLPEPKRGAGPFRTTAWTSVQVLQAGLGPHRSLVATAPTHVAGRGGGRGGPRAAGFPCSPRPHCPLLSLLPAPWASRPAEPSQPRGFLASDAPARAGDEMERTPPVANGSQGMTAGRRAAVPPTAAAG